MRPPKLPPPLFNQPQEPDPDPPIDTGTIHSTLPPELPKPNVELLRKIKALLPRMQGAEHAMKSGRIAALCGEEVKTTNEKVRTVMKWLLCVEHVPVVASGQGFYVAVTVEEIDAYIDNLRARMKGLERNIRELESQRAARATA